MDTMLSEHLFMNIFFRFARGYSFLSVDYEACPYGHPNF